jgi:hypothetical protein
MRSYFTEVKSSPTNILKYLLACCLLVFSITSNAQDEKQVLSALVNEFLSKVDDKEMHDRFWADDLIYTSSTGSRFGKDAIMTSFGTNSDVSTYSSEDLKMKLLGETALITSTLVRLTSDGETFRYLNTTVFAKREGIWVAVSHQSTKMASSNNPL